MILKTFCAFVALVLELFGVYGDGEFKWNKGYVSFSFTSEQISKVHTLMTIKHPQNYVRTS